LLDLAKWLEISKIIDGQVGKGKPDLSAGDLIVLAAINRADGQISQNAFHDGWFEKKRCCLAVFRWQIRFRP
jgi:hypothetical protein